jgi:hypothetical protein
MKVIGFKKKQFCLGQDKSTYLFLTLKVNVTVTSFVHDTPSYLNTLYIHIQSMKGVDFKTKEFCTGQDCLYKQQTGDTLKPLKNFVVGV